MIDELINQEVNRARVRECLTAAAAEWQTNIETKWRMLRANSPSLIPEDKATWLKQRVKELLEQT